MSEPDKSSLVVLVPEAERLVADLREKFDVSGICGLPAHVTVLYPFARPEALSPDLLGEVRSFFARQPRFRFSLVGVCGFPRVVYLAPEPLAAFDSLTREAAARFPAFLPYGGLFASPVPHLTVAQQPPADDLAELSSRLVEERGQHLPVECLARVVSLAVKRAGRWSLADHFPLA